MSSDREQAMISESTCLACLFEEESFQMITTSKDDARVDKFGMSLQGRARAMIITSTDAMVNKQ